MIRLCLLILLSGLNAQTLTQRLLVPVYLKYTLSSGYDNNFLKFSNGEMENAILNDPFLGNAHSFDSGYFKPSLQLIYSPQLINDLESNIIFKLSQAVYSGSKDKNYYALNSRLELHIGPYQWLKFSYNNLPNYYLRHYRDKDSFNDEYFDCSFTSESMGLSYSYPLVKNTWVELALKNKTEYFNSYFTEFDLIKQSYSLSIHKNFHKKLKSAVLFSSGKAENPSYGSEMVSTQFDRSYLLNRWELSLSKGISKPELMIQNIGFKLTVEERFYDLKSDQLPDNWKYYLETKTSVWMQKEVLDVLNVKGKYRYSNREADAKNYGDFEWLGDIKDYSRHEFSITVTYLTAIDFYY